MAAGLTVRADAIGRLRDFLNERMAGEQAAADALDLVEIDALIDPSAATRARIGTSVRSTTRLSIGTRVPIGMRLSIGTRVPTGPRQDSMT